jgi:hypothetical protein
MQKSSPSVSTMHAEVVPTMHPQQDFDHKIRVLLRELRERVWGMRVVLGRGFLSGLVVDNLRFTKVSLQHRAQCQYASHTTSRMYRSFALAASTRDASVPPPGRPVDTKVTACPAATAGHRLGAAYTGAGRASPTMGDVWEELDFSFRFSFRIQIPNNAGFRTGFQSLIRVSEPGSASAYAEAEIRMQIATCLFQTAYF